MATTSNQAAYPSISNFSSIFETAAKEYKKLTKKDLHNHPFATQLDRCDSPSAVLGIFQNQAQAFDQLRNGDERLMKWLSPTVHILFTFSATLGEGIGLPFPPAKTIFTGIGVLLSAAKDVVANHDTLVNLFERIQFFLQRLDIYIGMQLRTEMKDVLGKIMAQVLSILALSTKEMTQGRIKKYMKSLLGLGKADVQDALQRLDMLTREESGMALARNLEITHKVDGNVTAMMRVTRDVDGNVK
ncbi:hypothetical protein BJV78DRAFT_1354551, partial [Lactifluus subvellereus]